MEDTSERKAVKSSAQAVFGSDDLLSEILDKLPTEYFIKLQILSKEWNHLLSIPKCIKLQTNNHFPLGLILSHKDTLNHQSIHFFSDTYPKNAKSNTIFPSLAFLEKMGVFNIINSSNGLFLCRFSVKYRFRHCVINPGSRRVFIVPKEPGNPRGGSSVFALDFQPLESPFFKIVCFRDTCVYNERMMRKQGGLEILIYSSENGTWKTSRNSLDTEYRSTIMESPVSWNGKIISSICYVNMPYFDVYKEEMNIIPSAVKQADNTNRQYLGEWCGHLYSVYSIGKSTETRFQVFEWDKDSSKWFEKYSVSASKIFSELPSAVREVKGKLSEYPAEMREEMRILSYNYRILAVISEDGCEQPAIVLAIRGAIISYNFVHDTVRMLLVIPELQSYVSQLGAFPFYEDFLSYQSMD